MAEKRERQALSDLPMVQGRRVAGACAPGRDTPHAGCPARAGRAVLADAMRIPLIPHLRSTLIQVHSRNRVGEAPLAARHEGREGENYGQLGDDGVIEARKLVQAL